MRLLAFLILIIGGIFLQIFLSKKQSRWPGLILPLICLLFSLIAVLSVPAFYSHGELTMQELSPDGTVIEETVIQKPQEPAHAAGTAVVQVILVFALYNIPTAILLAIYFSCREKRKQRDLLDKMSIQDLE